MELQRRSSGVAKGGLATGITGTALGGLNTLTLLGMGANALGGGFGFGRNNQQPVVVVEGGGRGYGYGGEFRDGAYCSEDRHVNRYELQLEKENAAKDAEIALLKANTYNDQKTLELYKYVDGRFREFEQAFAAQAVNNQKTADDILRVQANLDCCCDKLATAINTEARERRCNDNAIVNYANNTFYAKMIADITTAATTTRQAVYNPLSCECSGCGNGQIIVQQVAPAAAATA